MKTTLAKTSDHLPNPAGSSTTQFVAREARDMTLAVTCPHCRGRFGVADATDDNMLVRCDNCPKEFRLANGMCWLDYLEFKVPLVIVGLWVFISQRIPAWCISVAVALLLKIRAFLLWLVPVSWKVVRVTGWVMLAASILVVPAMALGVAAFGVHRVLPPTFQYLSMGLGALAVGWVVLALGGYSWAFNYYRRKRKQRLAQIPVVLPLSPHAG
jgi:predicted Zn finger-like uncharacterized protein